MTLRPQHVTPELLNKVTKALGITALDQWYYVSHHAATRAIGLRALNQCGGTLSGFLKYAYPQHQFDEEKLTSRVNQEKDQKFIEIVIRKLFPNTEIHIKARKAVGIINPETGAYLEIDFWIPSLKLGIEYQDKHHYGDQWYANDTLQNYQKRDNIKKDIMSSLGYTLITIGYWWDKSLDSVAATIRQFRPDLLQELDIFADPIPSDPPLGHNTAPVIPGVAGIMNPFVPSNKYFDPTNWYAGEKHDGIRGVYNPKLRKMYSRSGNELSVLSSLLNDIPNILVEGEITAGRGNYNKTTVVSYHTHHDKVNWPAFRYLVFDIPNVELGDYTQRYSTITRELFAHPYVFAQSTFRVLLADKPHLKMLVDATISDAGEGMIVQQDAPYEYGRAKGLAKIKVRRDADAQVMRIDKFSCTCKLVSGLTADIIFSDEFDASNLKPGDIVSYYHNGYSQNGLPNRGEIYKVRYDISWEELLSEKEQNLAKRRSVKEAIGGGALSHASARNKMGHWNKPTNVRAFFDQFAQTSGFDSLIPDNWYPITTRTLMQAGGGGLFAAFSFNLSKALSRAYPEMTFDAHKFRSNRYKTKGRRKMKYGYWSKPPNVRAFFDEFARTSGFDPLVADNWYSVRARAVQQAGSGGLFNAHSFSLGKALSCAYPELNIDLQRFRTLPSKKGSKKKYGHWTKPQNLREFFNEFARASGFDPLVTKNWYSVTNTTLRKSGVCTLLLKCIA